MAKRRSLNDGLTPEEEAFLHQSSSVPAPVPTQKPRQSAKQKETTERSAPPVQAPIPVAAFPGVVSLNTRISASLGTALLAASMQRKIQRLEPFTQQDIVSEAVETWLKTNGYL